MSRAGFESLGNKGLDPSSIPTWVDDWGLTLGPPRGTGPPTVPDLAPQSSRASRPTSGGRRRVKGGTAGLPWPGSPFDR